MNKFYALATATLLCTALVAKADYVQEQTVQQTHWNNVDVDGNDVWDETENFQLFEPTECTVKPSGSKEGFYTLTNFQNSGADLDFQIDTKTSTGAGKYNIKVYYGSNTCGAYNGHSYYLRNAMQQAMIPVLTTKDTYKVGDQEKICTFKGTFCYTYRYPASGALWEAELLNEDDDTRTWALRIGTKFSGRLYDPDDMSQSTTFSKFYCYTEVIFVENREHITEQLGIVNAAKEASNVPDTDWRLVRDGLKMNMGKFLGSNATLAFEVSRRPVEGKHTITFTEGVDNTLDPNEWQTVKVGDTPATYTVPTADGGTLQGDLRIKPAACHVEVSGEGDFWYTPNNVYLAVELGGELHYVAIPVNLMSPAEGTDTPALFHITTKTDSANVTNVTVNVKADLPNSISIYDYLNTGMNIRVKIGALQDSIQVTGTGVAVKDSLGNVIDTILPEYFQRYPLSLYEDESRIYGPGSEDFVLPVYDGKDIAPTVLTGTNLNGEDKSFELKTPYLYVNDGASRIRVFTAAEDASVPEGQARYNVRMQIWSNQNYYLSFDLYGPAPEKSSLKQVIVDGNAPVEYYNLQGVRVLNPGHGFYIRRQGQTVDKVRL